MTATNHVLTGTLIGLTVHHPALAIVLAVVSHFVLDAIPHFASPSMTGKKLAPLLATDATCALLILFGLVIVQPQYWLLAVVCGIAAASPDLMWFPVWVQDLRGEKHKPLNIFQKFHSKIQWAEKPYNYPYEIVWFLVCLVTLVKAM